MLCPTDVSRAHLPVAIWNDRWYDIEAIFTGSATVVDGKPYIVYPGLCDKAHVGCTTYADYAIAVPSNVSDPLYTDWSKRGYENENINPIVNGTSDDPSTAWETGHGEWRLIGNGGAVGQNNHSKAPIFAATNFEGPWKLVGDSPFTTGECQSFFPLPGIYPGSAASSDPMPTHVHKRGHGAPGCSGDCMQMGTYVQGVPGSVGEWSQTPGVPFDEVLIDHGHYYASKDFFDPVMKRRILWGWATIPGGCQSLPRSITYHPELKQLVYSPIEELAGLRGKPLATLGSTPLAAGTPLELGKGWPSTAGRSADVNISFAMPTTPTRLSVAILGGAVTAFADFVSKTNVTVGFGSLGGSEVGTAPPPANKANMSRFMPNFDLGGGDYSIEHHPPNTDPAVCQKLCDGQPKCKAWTYVIRGSPTGSGDCCLKSVVPCPRAVAGGDKMWSGAKVAGEQTCLPHSGGGGGGGVPNTLQLLSSDAELTIRVFVDNQVLEAYFMDGRVAITAAAPGTVQSGAVAVESTAAGKLVSAEVFPMSGIWISPEEVLAMPRPDHLQPALVAEYVPGNVSTQPL